MRRFSEGHAMRAPVLLPDVGVEDRTKLCVSCWFVETGDEVLEGDRLVEILAGAVTFDVPAPAAGRLAEICAFEEDPVRAGDILAYLETDEA
jgi:2-oxoglutarate dehydrogenase E2 component (dihydrolipoamide succinyltransferase)